MEHLPTKESRQEFFSKLSLFHSKFCTSAIKKYMDEKTEIRVFTLSNWFHSLRLVCLVALSILQTPFVPCMSIVFMRNSRSIKFGLFLNRLHYPLNDFNAKLIINESEIDEMNEKDVDIIISLFREYVLYLPQLSELTSVTVSSGSKPEIQAESKLISIIKVWNWMLCEFRCF